MYYLLSNKKIITDFNQLLTPSSKGVKVVNDVIFRGYYNHWDRVVNWQPTTYKIKVASEDINDMIEIGDLVLHHCEGDTDLEEATTFFWVRNEKMLEIIKDSFFIKVAIYKSNPKKGYDLAWCSKLSHLTINKGEA